ncbi:hypothetical protein DIPPA_23706 [Diplonema papillatum]|nr:hypothetical protein DIPPA_23706 [Diplonema papillatum]
MPLFEKKEREPPPVDPLSRLYSFPADSKFWTELIRSVGQYPGALKAPHMHVDCPQMKEGLLVNAKFLKNFIVGWEEVNPHVVCKLDAAAGSKGDRTFHSSNDFWRNGERRPDDQTHSHHDLSPQPDDALRGATDGNPWPQKQQQHQQQGLDAYGSSSDAASHLASHIVIDSGVGAGGSPGGSPSLQCASRAFLAGARGPSQASHCSHCGSFTAGGAQASPPPAWGGQGTPAASPPQPHAAFQSTLSPEQKYQRAQQRYAEHCLANSRSAAAEYSSSPAGRQLPSYGTAYSFEQPAGGRSPQRAVGQPYFPSAVPVGYSPASLTSDDSLSRRVTSLEREMSSLQARVHDKNVFL